MRLRAVFGPALDELVLAHVEVADATTGRVLETLGGGNESFVEAMGGEDSLFFLGDPNFDGYRARPLRGQPRARRGGV